MVHAWNAYNSKLNKHKPDFQGELLIGKWKHEATWEERPEELRYYLCSKDKDESHLIGGEHVDMLGLEVATKFREEKKLWLVGIFVKTITGWYATDFGGSPKVGN